MARPIGSMIGAAVGPSVADCLLCYSPGRLIEISFGLECIYARRTAPLVVCDMLITNLSDAPLQAVDILYPHALVDLRKAKPGGATELEIAGSRFRARTAELLDLKDAENWYYGYGIQGTVDEDAATLTVEAPPGASSGLQETGTIREHALGPHPQLNGDHLGVLQEGMGSSVLRCTFAEEVPPLHSTWLSVRLFPRERAGVGTTPRGAAASVEHTVGFHELKARFRRRLRECRECADDLDAPLRSRAKHLLTEVKRTVMDEGFAAEGTYTRAKSWRVVLVPQRFSRMASLRPVGGTDTLEGPFALVQGRRRWTFWQHVTGYEEDPTQDLFETGGKLYDLLTMDAGRSGTRGEVEELIRASGMGNAYVGDVEELAEEAGGSARSVGPRPLDLLERWATAIGGDDTPELSYELVYEINWGSTARQAIALLGSLAAGIIGGLLSKHPTIAVGALGGGALVWAAWALIRRFLEERAVKGR